MLKYDIRTGVKKIKTRTALAISGAGLAVVGLIMAVAMPLAAKATTAAVYDATPSTLPPNVVSLGFEATSTSEFGDYVHLGGTNRSLKTVTVTMSTWARNSEYPAMAASGWTHPITVNIYNSHLSAGVPDQKIATVTQSVPIPWRPEGNSACPDTGYGAGFAWKASDGQCYNGKAFNATFDMSSLNSTLPNDVIVGVAYNTADYGAVPIHAAGPYNSLNVGIPSGQAASVGTDDNANNVFWNTSVASFYTDGGTGGTGTFRQDTNWAPNGTVAIQITASAPTPTGDQCKNNGWKSLKDSGNRSFKNQGDCVSYFATNGRNTANGASHFATGNVTLSNPTQTLSFTGNDNGPSSADTGTFTYTNTNPAFTYTASLTCVNVIGNTAYLTYQIPSSAAFAANTWVIWKVVDNGTSDSDGFTTAPDMASANALCETGSASVTNYAITAGDIVVQ